MANPISIGPEELLEQSLKIKKAARQLVEAHLNGLAKTLEPQVCQATICSQTKNIDKNTKESPVESYCSGK
ncbi:hypothetical protein PENTCL1PPCAC_5913 [Pristionchus entomophagus]|uniref:Uncharacterized protein n=1 Tax=Pristionchus entomophagus TaxID=358040 RepID=A0AAV5SNQ2_9BILA|nr:hypothetical protein PENTCL1PPCAC_5913 [Pristionchus entomophagus]